MQTQNVHLYSLFCRIAWAFVITQYQAIAFFFEYISTKKFRFSVFTVCNLLFNITITSTFLYLAFINYADPSAMGYQLKILEANLVTVISLYPAALFLVVFYKLYRVYSTTQVPTILKHQLSLLIKFFFFHIGTELLGYSISVARIFEVPEVVLTLNTLSTFFSSVALFYITKRIIGLRFLNIKKDVESSHKFNFLTHFKDILGQLDNTTSVTELSRLSQMFFQRAFDIPLSRTKLYLRHYKSALDLNAQDSITISDVEQYIDEVQKPQILSRLRAQKIFMKDDMQFTHFYEEDPTSKEILVFLDKINAAIFLPIFERSVVTAYIIIEPDIKPYKLFTSKERDEMLVFTTYLSNIINILKYSNIDVMHKRYQELTEELYQKHSEISQYKESLRTFVRNNKERKIGVIYYKNRRFTFANEAAKTLVDIDLNTTDGHPLTQTCKSIASKVLEYKTPQSTITIDSKGNKIIISAIQSIETQSIILLVYYPEVSDIIKTQVDQLKDPSMWDYVLYLETTQSGRLVNELIPGSSEALLEFKIQLLSTALSKKATLLSLPEDDLISTVEIIHAISLRQTLYPLKLTTPEKNDEIAIKLFGINPLMMQDAPQALLEKLDNVGTLFIENIENLSMSTQEYLAQFIAFGFFNKFKSNHKFFSNVRIICSTTKNLLELVNAEKFSRQLFEELQETFLVLPPLHELSQKEIDSLAQGFADQMVTSQTYKNLLSLTDKDKAKLFNERPLSINELKEKVHQLLLHKSTKHQIQEQDAFDPAYNVTDPDIAHAVRLGKRALKDIHVMTQLWTKFQNQNKIALLLGVNRSSVNRRCQEFNLK